MHENNALFVPRPRAAGLRRAALIVVVGWLAASAAAADSQLPTPPAAEALQAAGEYSRAHVGHALVVLFEGQIVFEQYDDGGAVDKPHTLASGQKGFIGPAAMAAVEDGLIRLDDPAADGISEWKNDPQKSAVTYRHLLSMTSGLAHPTDDEAKRLTWQQKLALPMVAKPGERFQYGGYELAVFAYALEQRLGPESFSQYLRRRILDPIGIQYPERRPAPDGTPTLGPGNLTARDWATYGDFVRLAGNWDGRKIVDQQLFRECFRGSRANPAYGLTWWVKAPMSDELIGTADAEVTKHWAEVAGAAGLPDDLVAALGAGTQRLYVIPSRRLVVVRQANDRSGGFQDLKFLRLLLNDGR